MEFALTQNFTQAIKDEWNELLAESILDVPFLRYEYLETWWQTRGGGEWPQEARLALITARRDGRLVGIAPLFAADWEGQPALLLVGSIEISDYLDLIVRPGDLDEFAAGLLDFISAAQFPFAWQRLDLYNVPHNSPGLEAIHKNAAARGWDCRLEPFRPALSIHLPGDWETYLAGIDKKQRHEIRRKMRRAYSGDAQVRWYVVREESELEGAIQDFLGLMAQDPEKARFLSAPMRECFRLTMRSAFANGYLFLSFLEIDGQRAAGYLNMDYLNQLWVYNSGMDASFTEYSPGWVLLGELLKWANDNGRQVFDFMRGDEDYKIRFGAQHQDVMRLCLARA